VRRQRAGARRVVKLQAHDSWAPVTARE
jgi:hypothetical protein